MTYIAGVVSSDGVYMSGDERATVGDSPTGDTLEKVHEVEYENRKFIYGISGRGSLSARVGSAIDNDIAAVERGDADQPSGPGELLDRVTKKLPAQDSYYEGKILIGGYGPDGRGRLCRVASPEFTPHCIEEDNPPFDSNLFPPGIPSIDEFDAAKEKAWAESNGDVEEYLRRISEWVAEHDESNSCSKEVNIVSV